MAEGVRIVRKDGRIHVRCQACGEGLELGAGAFVALSEQIRLLVEEHAHCEKRQS